MTETTTITANTILDVQTVALIVHLTALEIDLINQRVDLLRSNFSYVLSDRTDNNGTVKFEVVSNSEHKVRSIYDQTTWISELLIAPIEISHNFN